MHVLGENGRGAVIEAVISRMKTYAYRRSVEGKTDKSMRFIAVSATIPNIDDVRVNILFHFAEFKPIEFSYFLVRHLAQLWLSSKKQG